jgi:hypothetical protein
MTTYDIVISEGQRLLLIEALERVTTRFSESDMLLGLLKEIPQVERREGRISHGLCY